MMGNIWVFLAICLIALACNPAKESPITDLQPAAKAVSNPNGDSELALLMRAMTVYMEQSKDSLEQGKGIPGCPEEFKRLTEATETEGMIKDRNHFNAYAEQWLSDLDQVCQSKGKGQLQAYERLRTSCLNCHQSYCQGPIPKIQRLTVQNP
jgi:hypothetical protein